MPPTLGVPKETADGETRVALVPDVVRRLTGAGLRVVVEEGAGEGAYHRDADFSDAGGEIVDRAEALGAALVAVVSPPPANELRALGEEQTLVGLLDPLGDPERIHALAETGATGLAMELVPRISRAQKMDALSAMSSLAGYRAALIGAHALPKFFPLLTTAAGTIRPAQVLVLGAGVAGLQAIATARRLGAKVKGYDIRAATREEVESLGAGFVDLEGEIEGEGEGGYAKELDADIQERQPALLKPHVAKADVVIATALIPGRAAPTLVSQAAVEGMAPGSVVVDLAAPGGGNCALTEPGQTAEHGGVQVFGPTNLPAQMPVHASQLYARTIAAFVQDFVDEDGTFVADFGDEVFAGACVAHGGEVRARRVREALGLPAQEADPRTPEATPGEASRETTGEADHAEEKEEGREAERRAFAPPARGDDPGRPEAASEAPHASPGEPPGDVAPSEGETGNASLHEAGPPEEGSRASEERAAEERDAPAAGKSEGEDDEWKPPRA